MFGVETFNFWIWPLLTSLFVLRSPRSCSYTFDNTCAVFIAACVSTAVATLVCRVSVPGTFRCLKLILECKVCAGITMQQSRETIGTDAPSTTLPIRCIEHIVLSTITGNESPTIWKGKAALFSVQSAFLSMYKLRNIDPACAVGFKNIGNCFKDPSRMRCNMIDCVHTSDKSISLQIGTHTVASQVVWYDIMRSAFKHDRQFSQAGVPIMMANSTICILLSKWAHLLKLFISSFQLSTQQDLTLLFRIYNIIAIS